MQGNAAEDASRIRGQADRPAAWFAMPNDTQATTLFRIIVAMAWLWLLFAIAFLTDADCDFLVFLALFVSGLMLAQVWFILTPLFWHKLHSHAGCWWFSVPLAGGLGLFLALTDYGLVLRVALSEPWLNRHVQDVAEGVNSGKAPGWQGLMRVEKTEQDKGAFFLYASGGFLNRNGVAYLPHDNISPPPRIALGHLYGRWYRFTWRF